MIFGRKNKVEGKKFKCQNCKHEWNYKGKKVEYYTSCPRCRYNINIKKQLGI